MPADVDECASTLTNPCVNGQCINTIGSASCNCAGTAFTGQRCEQPGKSFEGENLTIFYNIYEFQIIEIYLMCYTFER